MSWKALGHHPNRSARESVPGRAGGPGGARSRRDSHPARTGKSPECRGAVTSGDVAGLVVEVDGLQARSDGIVELQVCGRCVAPQEGKLPVRRLQLHVVFLCTLSALEPCGWLSSNAGGRCGQDGRRGGRKFGRCLLSWGWLRAKTPQGATLARSALEKDGADPMCSYIGR